MLLRPRKQKNSHFNVSPKMSAKKNTTKQIQDGDATKADVIRASHGAK